MNIFNIKAIVEQYGIVNVRIFAPMRRLDTTLVGFAFTNSSTPEDRVQTTLFEGRYKFKDSYKLTLQAITIGYGHEHFYIDDFNQLVKDGHFDVYVQTEDGLQPIHVTLKNICEKETT